MNQLQLNSSHYHPHHPAPPVHPPTTTVEVHQGENSNEIFVIPTSPSIPNGQSPLNF